MKMKNNFFKAIVLTLTVGFLSSCSEERPIESDVTFFAEFEYEPLVVIALGGTYAAEVNAIADGESLKVSSSGAVDTNTVGVYDVTYSATNKDGFDGIVTQTIVIHDPSIIGTDVSGAIQDVGRPERTGVISLIPGTTSIFYATDFAFGGVFPMYFQMDGDTISEINQNYIFSVTSAELTYDPVTKIFSNTVLPYGFSYTFEYQ